MVEGDADALGEVGAEQRDLGVALTEVVQHDEVGVHLHPDADCLRGRAGGAEQHQRVTPSFYVGFFYAYAIVQSPIAFYVLQLRLGVNVNTVN